MPTREAEFTPSIKRDLRILAGDDCSLCKKHTPKGQGKACHICASEPGGRRYVSDLDPAMTLEYRQSIANAIWLCGSCHDKVDSADDPWSEARLLALKYSHEVWVANNRPEIEQERVRVYALEFCGTNKQALMSRSPEGASGYYVIEVGDYGVVFSSKQNPEMNDRFALQIRDCVLESRVLNGARVATVMVERNKQGR